jgi:hypothetical protein
VSGGDTRDDVPVEQLTVEWPPAYRVVSAPVQPFSLATFPKMPAMPSSAGTWVLVERPWDGVSVLPFGDNSAVRDAVFGTGHRLLSVQSRRCRRAHPDLQPRLARVGQY